MTQGFQQSDQHRTVRRDDFLQQAQQLEPQLHHTQHIPCGEVLLTADAQHPHGWRTTPGRTLPQLEAQRCNTGDEFIIDLGTHCVGYLQLHCAAVGSPQDAPVHLQFIFGETSAEVAEDFASYQGWLSSSWLQQEDCYLDVLPATLALPRRYCCRFIKIRVVATSLKFGVQLSDMRFTSVTSAGELPARQPFSDPLLAQIDDISVLTLKNCMQSVFEDGPKRDRRLWLGDLRLQALVNYATFRQNDLVKRCLYLFAAVPRADGMVPANVFIQPEVVADDTYLTDYSLLFIATLADYYASTDDLACVRALWPTAWRQAELALERLDARGLLSDSDEWWAFIDWHSELNKQAAAQGVLIYCLQKALLLADVAEPAKVAPLNAALQRLKTAAMQHLWQPESGFFTSGAAKQISWASQVWLVLADVGDTAFQAALLDRLQTHAPDIRLQTPYMMHHYIEALLKCGMRTTAEAEVKAYWGAMAQQGADTFWEVFDPQQPRFSPYGSSLINSYCHAWSCTPAWLLRQ